MIPTDITPPIDPEQTERRVHLSDFIKTELAARAGVVTTGTSATVSWLAWDPMLSIVAKFVTIVVGVLTAVSICFGIAEKIRARAREDE